MREDIAGPQGASSRPMWETLEGMVREKAQEFIQQIMEEEVTELLGREKSERRSTVDSAEGYRNGYGKPRRLAMSSGTITLRRPRVRGVEERFESRVLPLFARRTKELGALLPELYLHGLAEGDFELAMRGLLGEGAPLSKSSIRRLRAGWTAEFEEWSQRRLEGREVVYVWADGIYVKAGLERDKAALLVVLGAMRDGTKEVLALRSGHESFIYLVHPIKHGTQLRVLEVAEIVGECFTSEDSDRVDGLNRWRRGFKTWLKPPVVHSLQVMHRQIFPPAMHHSRRAAKDGFVHATELHRLSLLVEVLTAEVSDHLLGNVRALHSRAGPVSLNRVKHAVFNGPGVTIS